MKTEDIIEALAEQLARAFIRQLEPLLRELLAAQPAPPDTARALSAQGDRSSSAAGVPSGV